MIIFIGIMIILIIINFFVGNFFYNIAINVKTSKKFIFKHTDSETEEEKEKRRQIQEDEVWLKQHAQSCYMISTQDHLKLHGYCIKKEKNSHQWAIIIHGYTAQAVEMTFAAKNFLKLGYHVVMVDLRGHGKSDGEYIGMGWHDRLDIIDWIQYIIDQDENAEIVLYGVSMGAATVMMTIGEDLPSNVKIAIEDCGYTSVWDEFKWELKVLFKLPAFPILYVANIVTKIRAGYSLKEASCIKQLQKAKIPILFIHGENDKFVPFSMQAKLIEATNAPKEKLIIKDAAHAESSRVNPEIYWHTIEKFIEKNR